MSEAGGGDELTAFCLVEEEELEVVELFPLLL